MYYFIVTKWFFSFLSKANQLEIKSCRTDQSRLKDSCMYGCSNYCHYEPCYRSLRFLFIFTLMNFLKKTCVLCNTVLYRGKKQDRGKKKKRIGFPEPIVCLRAESNNRTRILNNVLFRCLAWEWTKKKKIHLIFAFILCPSLLLMNIIRVCIMIMKV